MFPFIGRTDHINEYKPRSLNYEKRVLEFHKISGENLKTLQRLKSVKPQYSTSLWESEFKEHLSIKKNLSMFPSELLEIVSWCVCGLYL